MQGPFKLAIVDESQYTYRIHTAWEFAIGIPLEGLWWGSTEYGAPPYPVSAVPEFHL